jgi:NAD(P)H-dependent FMN reductase
MVSAPARVSGQRRRGRRVEAGWAAAAGLHHGDQMTRMTDITVLGVAGSPRLKSTHYAVNEALEYAGERYGVATDYFTVHKKTIGFCKHCDFCIRKKQGCVIDDDMGELYPKLLQADAWILGSPVYQGQVSGQLKAVLDRCRALVARDAHAFRDKVGGGICVGGDRSGGQEPALQALIGPTWEPPSGRGTRALRASRPTRRGWRRRTGSSTAWSA